MNLVRHRGAVAAALLLTAGGLTACETDQPDYVPAYAAGVPSRVVRAEVINYRPVNFGANGDTVAASTVAGAVGGGLIGAAAAPRWQSGGYGVLGALGGALIGNAVARGSTHRGFAYVIRRRDGRTMEVAQPGTPPIPVGTPVYVSFGPRVTITPIAAYGAPPPGAGYGAPPPPPPPPGS